MHKNSKIRHSISLRESDQVFENSKIRHFKSSKMVIKAYSIVDKKMISAGWFSQMAKWKNENSH